MRTDDNDLPSLSDLESDVQRSPLDVSAWRHLANAYGARNLQDLSIDVLKHALRLAPSDVVTHQQLGHALLTAARPQEALEYFREAARLDTRNPAYRAYCVGWALAAAGEHAAAADQFRQVVALGNGYERWAWRRLATALHADGRYAETISAFERAAGIWRNDARLWAALGTAYAKTGQHLRAIQAYRLSLRINPYQASVQLWLGISCRTLGYFDEARAAFEEAGRLDPAESEPFLELRSLAFDSQGREAASGKPQAQGSLPFSS